jgi:hypothetical protein
MLVTLPGVPSGADVFGGGLKNGSSFHELLAGGDAGFGPGAAFGVCAGLRPALLKNCVKLPPAADSYADPDAGPADAACTGEAGAAGGAGV